MTNALNLIRDYKANIPLAMLSNKYKMSVHSIINIIHAKLVERLLLTRSKPKMRSKYEI